MTKKNMNIYNTCKMMIVIIVSAIIIAVPLSAKLAKKGAARKPQLAQTRQQLTQCQQQLIQVTKELIEAKKYKLLAMGLLRQSTLQTASPAQEVESGDNEDENDEDENSDTEVAD